ncbi:MAG TPA: hypothetical protein VKC55_01475 [Actinomycetota bacterium]|nr:hypothetical protein [Actinomycetota bacterium]
MSATVQTTQVGTYRTRESKPFAPLAASLLRALLAASVVAGLFAISFTSAGTGACIARVGCVPAVKSDAAMARTSFAAIGAKGASAIWFEMAVEPASPVLEHFLHPTSAIVDRSRFEPVSPALAHFLHPAPGIAEYSAFESVSPALEHFLH